MGIYIEGMEMPKNCDSCPCYYETEGAWRNECKVLQREHYITDERPNWCPLVHIPPHGDLIDRDVLIQSKEIDSFGAVFAVAKAPTVIPADMETDP